MWPVYPATGRDGMERDGECQVCHASETFACVCDAVYCGARLCANPTMCARVEASEAIMCTGTTAAELLYAANPSRRPSLRATHFIGANTSSTQRKATGCSRHSRGSLSDRSVKLAY